MSNTSSSHWFWLLIEPVSMIAGSEPAITIEFKYTLSGAPRAC
jgi:hypothetical protein